MTDLAVVPATLALLPAYAGRLDPVPKVRAATDSAVAWLVERSAGLVVVAGRDRSGRPDDRPAVPAGLRIARTLLDRVGSSLPTVEVVVGTGPMPTPDSSCGVLVVADGSARRSVQAPGHLDARSHALDDAVQAALASGDPARLAQLDAALAEELLCGAVPVLQSVGTALAGSRATEAVLDLGADPYGVQYWVARWRNLR